VFGDEEWQTFCRVMGKPGLAKDERFATLAKRKENEDELDRIVEEWTVGSTAEEVMLLLQQAGVGAGVVQNAEDQLVRDPQLRAREYYAHLDHAETGRSTYDGMPYRLSATPWVIRKPAPLFGEHTVYVAEELLGMSVDEVSQCYTEGVLE
jgi:crotonobetainyl-CoA:carnitine CoA-transferase CaiB-like acyl-CoA transferase